MFKGKFDCTCITHFETGRSRNIYFSRCSFCCSKKSVITTKPYYEPKVSKRGRTERSGNEQCPAEKRRFMIQCFSTFKRLSRLMGYWCEPDSKTQITSFPVVNLNASFEVQLRTLYRLIEERVDYSSSQNVNRTSGKKTAAYT